MSSQDVLIGVVVFFVVATSGLALLLLPELRAWVVAALKRWTAGGRSATAAAATVGHQHLRGASGVLTTGACGALVRSCAARC